MQIQKMTFKQLRLYRGIKMIDLAGLCGVNRSTIYLVESGKRFPSWHLFDRLSYVLDVRPSTLTTIFLMNTWSVSHCGWTENERGVQERFLNHFRRLGVELERGQSPTAKRFLKRCHMAGINREIKGSKRAAGLVGCGR